MENNREKRFLQVVEDGLNAKSLGDAHHNLERLKNLLSTRGEIDLGMMIWASQLAYATKNTASEKMIFITRRE